MTQFFLFVIMIQLSILGVGIMHYLERIDDKLGKR